MSNFFEILSGGARLKKAKELAPSLSTSAPFAGIVSFLPIKPTAKTQSSKRSVYREKAQEEASEDSDDSINSSSLRLSSHTSPLNSPKRPTSRSTSPKQLLEASVKKIAILAKDHHGEEIAAFRRRMKITLNNDCHPPDPITTFGEIPLSSSSSIKNKPALLRLKQTILNNVDTETSRWKNPTPIQMQAIPSLLANRDVIGAAPTGSGKSGCFLIPAIIISSRVYDEGAGSGEIRSLILAPSGELARQLHREVVRLSEGKAGGYKAALLEKKNSKAVIDGSIGGKTGLDCLVATPLRLCELIGREGGEKVLEKVRMVVLDEADRLLDARSDGSNNNNNNNNNNNTDTGSSMSMSGSSNSLSYLSQIDCILSSCSPTSIRSLFSATINDAVKTLAESVLRDPIEITVNRNGAKGNVGGAGAGVSSDVEQKLLFVGKEEGKLLEIRSLVNAGGLKPPVLIFVQSKERANALHSELNFDKIKVDVIHGGRSQAARESAVNRFRMGETWVLICTDLVARGLDFKAVNTVINYDFPQSGVDYVHRIGRCGRGGRKGLAITYFTERDFGALRGVANIMKVSGCENVEEWMLSMKRESGNEKRRRETFAPRREMISTSNGDEKKKKRRKQLMINQSLNKNKKKGRI